MRSVDPLQQVAAYRPTTATIDREWPAVHRAVTLDRVLAADTDTDTDLTGASVPVRSAAPTGTPADASTHHNPPVDLASRRMSRPPQRRRGLLAAGLVAAAVAAVLLVQLLVPSGEVSPASAAALDQLASAAAGGGQPLQPGQFRHQVVRSTQNGVTWVQETWTAVDGHAWQYDSRPGGLEYIEIPPGEDSVNLPSPAFLATLPTDPSALNSYLRAHVSGSTSTDEAVFVAVGDMLRGGFAPPALAAAALKVLQMTPYVIVGSGQDSLGRSVEKVSFIDQRHRPDETQSLLFDPATAAILEEQMSAPGHSFTSTVVEQDVVDAVPAAVLGAAVPPGGQETALPGDKANTQMPTTATG